MAARRKTGAPSKGRRGSKLTARLNRRRNTQSGRNQMSRSSFALPRGTGSDPSRPQYRMDTLAHARNARARVKQHGSKTDQRKVFAATARKWPSLKQSRSSR